MSKFVYLKESYGKLEKFKIANLMRKSLKQNKFVNNDASGIYNNLLANYKLQIRRFFGWWKNEKA